MQFIVNKRGGVHSVEDADAKGLLAKEGYRKATAAEIANWYAAQGLEAPKPAKVEKTEE